MRSGLRTATPGLVVTGLVVVIALGVLVSTGVTAPVDAAIILAVRDPSLDGALSPLRWVTELGSTWAVAAVAVATLAIGWLIGPWRLGVWAAMTVLMASILNAIAKFGIRRARPDLLEPLIDARDFSFPSGHSSLSAVAYGLLAVLVARSRLGSGPKAVVIAALVTIVLGVGLSRIYLGVHYPTDVLAGWVAGAAVVLVFAALTRRSEKVPPEEAAGAREVARSERA